MDLLRTCGGRGGCEHLVVRVLRRLLVASAALRRAAQVAAAGDAPGEDRVWAMKPHRRNQLLLIGLFVSMSYRRDAGHAR